LGKGHECKRPRVISLVKCRFSEQIGQVGQGSSQEESWSEAEEGIEGQEEGQEDGQEEEGRGKWRR